MATRSIPGIFRALSESERLAAHKLFLRRSSWPVAGIDVPGGLGTISGGLANWQALTAFVLLIVWFVVEAVVRARARTQSRFVSGASQDRGSGLLLIVLVLVAIIGSSIASQGKVWLLPDLVFYFGIAVMVVGIVVRAWAISHLGRYFSSVVRTSAEQRIVRTGPYRLVRHPSYTGMVLALVGYSIALVSLAGIIITIFVIVIGFGYRICVEEAALAERFGEEYH